MNKKDLGWLISGIAGGVGYIIGTFYMIFFRRDEYRWLGLLYLIGPVGSVLMYYMTRKENKELARMSLLLLLGFTIWVIIALPLNIDPFYQYFGYIHGWIGD
jgi:tryptophan-rich sensory protein